MIAPSAIEKFLKIPMNNWDWIKECSEEVLLGEVQKQDKNFKFHGEPRLHQLQSFVIGLNQKSFLYFFDMGGGKTYLSLQLMRYYNKNGILRKSLVVVNNEAAIGTWVEEIGKFSSFTVVDITGTKEQKLNKFKKEADIYVILYDSVVSLFGKKVPVKNKKGKFKTVADTVSIDEILTGFDAVFYDEIHFCKGYKTARFSVCKEISKKMLFRYGLTGTPFYRDLHDLWSIYYLIDLGKTLGYTLTVYRSAFFEEKKGFFNNREYTIKKELKPLLMQRLKNRSIHYSSDEFDGMVLCTKKIIYIDVPEGYKEYYNKLVSGISIARGDYRELDNIYTQLRMICAGYLGFKNEDGEKLKLAFPENPKLDILMEHLKSLPESSSAVIFYDYTLSGDFIEEALKEAQIGYCRLYGKTKNKKEVVSEFKKDSRIKVFLTNSKSGGTSLNLQKANHAFFYQSPTSGIVRQQCDKRIDRPGQTRLSFIYDLVYKNTVEEKLLEYHAEGKDLFKEMIKGELLKQI